MTSDKRESRIPNPESRQLCDRCKKPVGESFENPKKRGEFLCFDCLDKTVPEYVDKYPGWREREQARRRRAQTARANFGHRDPSASLRAGSETQRGLFR